MNIIELAKEMLQRKVYLGAMGFECTDAQLEAFATAIIENYKATAFRGGILFSAKKFADADAGEKFTGNDVAGFLEMECSGLSDAEIKGILGETK